MKYLKILLGIILLLVLIFLAIGLFVPSISYESEVTVNKSAAESWAVMSDEANLGKWIDGFKRTELVSGTENTLGAVSHVYVRGQSEEDEMMMTETITKFEKNKVMGMTFTMDFMDMEYEMNFKEEGGKTVIQSKSKTKGNSIWAKPMVALMKGAMKEQEDNNMKSLKNIIDSNTKNYFPSEEIIGTIDGEG